MTTEPPLLIDVMAANDSNGDVFDPEIHAVNEDGAPRFNKDGSYAKKRGRKKGSASSDNVRSMPRKSQKKAVTGTDYRPGIVGLFQLVSVPLSFTSPLDAWAVGAHSPSIADALNDLAKQRPEVAAVLERVLQVGPYGALIGAVLPLGIQILTNHSRLPDEAAESLGAIPREKLLAELGARSDARNAA